MTQAQYERIKKQLNQKWQSGEIHADEYFGTLDLMDQDPDLGAAEASRILGVKIAPDPGDRAAKRAEAEVEKKIKGVYGTAAKELKEKLGSLEKDYAERLEKKQKELAEGKITQDELKAWVRSQLLQQKQVKDQIDQCTGVLLHANEKALGIVNQEQLGVFAENANFQEYQINQDTGLNLMFSVYDEHSVERLIRDNPDLLPPKMVNGKKDKAWNQARITSAVTQAIIQGESIPALAKRIAAESAGGNAAAMMRYARTAMTAAQNAGRVEMLHRAQGLGVKCRKRWMATLDSRTRDSHQEMDGEVVGVDDEFSNGLLYPGDPNGAPGEVYNCRCTMTYEYDGIDNALQERRDNETGEMIEYHTYEEWKKQNAPVPEKKEAPAKKKKTETAREAKEFYSTEDALDYYVETGEKWVNNLTEAEKSAVSAYGYNYLSAEGNGYLHGDKTKYEEYQVEDIKKQIANLDSAIAKGTINDDLLVYRGVGKDYLGLDFSDPEKLIGKEITDSAYLSTSLSKEVAEIYGRGVVIETRIPEGTHAAWVDITQQSGQEMKEYYKKDGDAGNIELLIERGGSYKFTGYTIEKGPDGREYVKMTAEFTPPAAKAEKEKPDAAQELKETIDSHKGKWTEVELRDVGKKAAAVMEDIRKEKGYYENQGQVEKAKAEADKIWENASKLHAEWKDAKGEPGANDRWNAYKEEYDKFTKAQREVTRAQKSLDDHDATVMDLLSRVRKLGKFTVEDVDDLADFSRATANEKKLRSELIKAFNHYPEEWAINSAENWLTLKPEWNEGRAYYSITSGTIKISSKEGINLHELAHRFEKTVPGILQAEKEFYERRTAGEEAKWIGKGYDHDEVTRKDNFLDKYMGKDYNGDAYELCSMGFEYAFTNYKRLCKDEDFRDFILGILCGV